MEEEKEQERITLNPQLKEIRKRPYDFICNYVESVYPATGKKVFEILALMPVSLIIPDIPFMNKTIRSNINALFLAPPGAGKTSISDLFSNFTYHPIKVESITSAKLEQTIAQMPVFTLIVGDFARMSRDENVVKVIEGLLGEEKRISRKTMRKDISMEAEGLGLLCGVATDLHFYLLSGLIFRVCPILISHGLDEHVAIGKHIKEQMGSKNNSNNSEQLIKEFYMELASIQANRHPEIAEVKGYNIPSDFREKIFAEWQKLTTPIVNELGFSWFRELQEGFRLMISHAFLNVYNRKVQEGTLYLEEEDLRVALKLMKRTIVFKYRLMKTERMAKGISNAKEFDAILADEKIPDEYKNILRNLVKVKEGGRVRMGR